MTNGNFDIVIIGGGIVGLATAMSVSRRFPKLRLLLLEKENRVARHQTGHNSGVIHSGIYYKPGSYKARLCVEGARLMIEFCGQRGIPHEICGKVIVATDEEEFPRLQTLMERGQANGLSGIRELNAAQIREIEPHCSGLRGIYVPGTGITDYAAVSEKLAEILRAEGAQVLTATEVIGFAQKNGTAVLETSRGAFAAPYVINCAGLHSDRISRMAGQKPELRIIPFRGEYYDLTPEKEYLVKSLIYPVPDPRFPFLGVHFTRKIRGGVDAGPNAVLAFKREGYRWGNFSFGDAAETLTYPGFWRMVGKYWRYGLGEVQRSLNKQAFVKALQRLIPEIKSEDLVADGSGVRAQAVRPDGSLVDDFQFTRAGNTLNVCNVPSPAATASLAIGEEIATMAEKEFGISRN
jgi:(S)-2-hydroxyglutarate dehydrogenase